MLSLKKKSEATAPQAPAWHPNFRNYQQLPDIKVVRTAFFVNGTAAFIALGLVVYFFLRESDLRGINRNIKDFEQRVADNKAGSDKAIADYVKFKDQEKRIKEVDAFTKSKPLMSELVLRFGETRPKTIALGQIDIRAPDAPPGAVPTVVLRGTARGAVSQATNEVNSYVDLLRADAKIGPRLDPGPDGVHLNGQAVDAVNEIVTFEIAMKFKSTSTPLPAAKK